MDFDYRIIFKIESFLILGLLYTGIYFIHFKKDKIKHYKCMLTGIILDLLLVLQIELTRGAIGQAINPSKNTLLLNVHIPIAVSTVILYIFILYSGFQLKEGQFALKKIHLKIGILAIILRTFNFATSLFVN